ncbi:MAG: tRNA uridine-5-carboxymethylaminomethyl(34) synthesis GTPase MnmE [Chitinispirillia bacterium]|nr:tRNA uridine-5-carboxymethylaminomethyl(34) synthesis GTPase MnmE [Chitinispirillia bacterium]
MNISTNTIAALSTPPGRGALAVIRMTGDDAHEIFASVISEKEKFQKEENRKIGIYTVVDNNPVGTKLGTELTLFHKSIRNKSNSVPDTESEFGDGVAFIPHPEGVPSFNPGHRPGICPTQIIDEVTAIKYSSPKSFTGENMVEILCHGGTIITAKILDRLFRAGTQPAGRGEFSRRALLNGKIDLLRAESIASLIDSQTEKHHESALIAYQGNQRNKIENYKSKIIDLLSDIESRIEFGEEDAVANSQVNTKTDIEKIAGEFEEELRRSELIKRFDEGIILALAGPPNAGKSSLFNEILGFDRSIVHDRAGTTRDVISEKVSFDGITVKLFDCAGIRETQDDIEQKGIERTLSAVKEAHFILWVTSADEVMGHQEEREILENAEKTLVVINKIDKLGTELHLFRTPKGRHHLTPGNARGFCAAHNLKHIEISIKEKINIEKLFADTALNIREITGQIAPPEIIVNDRHRGVISSALRELKQTIDNIEREEIAAQYLRNALNLLSEFSGHVTNDEVMNNIFDKFCIGK